MKANFIINPDDKHYPSANEWMWDYCIFLGKFTDSQGRNFDLGIHISHFSYLSEIVKEISDATVHSNEAGNYSSGSLTRHVDKDETREWKLEVIRRAKILNLM